MKTILYGTTLMLSLLILTGCSKKSDPTPDVPPAVVDKNPTSTASAYLVFFDGTAAVKIEAGVNGVVNGAGSGGSNSYSTAGGDFLTFSSNKGEVTYGGDFGGFPSHSDVYYDYTTGANDFGSELNNTNGFIITYKDANGTIWSTDKGARTQTNSTINITYKSAYYALDQYYRVEGNFNCTVYNDNGKSKKLTNGKFKSIFGYN